MAADHPEAWTVPLEAGAAVTALAYVAAAANERHAPALILAHGAGADQRSAFMVQAARALQARGITAVTFNFPYKEQHRTLPDRTPVLEACYRAVVQFAHAQPAIAGGALFIGGKSMGGRIATQIAAADRALPIAGLVALGYPLHPPGKPQQRRDAHLPSLGRPLLVVQGSRDSFGTPEELESVLAQLHPRATLHVVDGGDHSFKVARTSAARQQATFAGILDTVAHWLERTATRRRL